MTFEDERWLGGLEGQAEDREWDRTIICTGKYLKGCPKEEEKEKTKPKNYSWKGGQSEYKEKWFLLINKTNKQTKYNQRHWNWEQADSDQKGEGKG